MIYRVRVGYNDFDFEDPAQAMIFAKTAMDTYVPIKGDDTLRVEITLIKEVDNA